MNITKHYHFTIPSGSGMSSEAVGDALRDIVPYGTVLRRDESREGSANQAMFSVSGSQKDVGEFDGRLVELMTETDFPKVRLEVYKPDDKYQSGDQDRLKDLTGRRSKTLKQYEFTIPSDALMTSEELQVVLEDFLPKGVDLLRKSHKEKQRSSDVHAVFSVSGDRYDVAEFDDAVFNMLTGKDFTDVKLHAVSPIHDSSQRGDPLSR